MAAVEVQPPSLNPSIPQLDFSCFTGDVADGRKSFSKELVDALSRLGFVTIINHPFTKEEIEQVFYWSQRFFALPHPEKMKAAHPAEANPHRGYSYIGQERLTSAVEIKETFDQGSAHDPMYPNRWPPESSIPGFRSFMEDFFDRCHSVHNSLLAALQVGLDLDTDVLINRCSNNSSELRLNHYPSCMASEILQFGARRIAEHSDFGTLTLLFQDGVGGLEVERQDIPGSFFSVPPEEDGINECGVHAPRVMIVNAGDCMQRWTNDKLKSARHRVVLPPDVRSNDIKIKERYSVAYFAKPDREQHVGTLEQFYGIGGDGPKYNKISAWDFNQQRLGGTY